jgi:hypothetical protein
MRDMCKVIDMTTSSELPVKQEYYRVATSWVDFS